jgi:hypothetical protein
MSTHTKATTSKAKSQQTSGEKKPGTASKSKISSSSSESKIVSAPKSTSKTSTPSKESAKSQTTTTTTAPSAPSAHLATNLHAAKNTPIENASPPSLSLSSAVTVQPAPPAVQENEVNFLKGQKVEITDFEMLKQVGTGTFGVIRIAKHIKTGKCVAVKTLNKQKMWKLNQVEHLKNERDILFRVPHPRIVNLFASCQVYFYSYIILNIFIILSVY